jgi:hypothetical protein
METLMEAITDNEKECCPRFYPEKWDDKIIQWDNKKFIKENIKTFFYMPLNFGRVMKRLDKKLSEANTTILDGICLSDHTSRWNMDLYVAVDKDLPGYDSSAFSGNFFSKVYEGPFQDTGKWGKDFEAQAKLKGFTIKKWYMWYTTCPKCAKKYGKNYVAIISQVG